MNKKTLIILIVLGVVLLIAAGTAFILLRQAGRPAQEKGEPTSIFGRLPIIGGRLGGPEIPAPEGEIGGTPETTTQPPEITGRRVEQLTDEAVIGPVFDAKTQKILYYKKSDGHLIAKSPSGENEETISNLTILNILDVRWAPDRKKSIITYKDGNDLKKFIVEATSSPKVVFLPKEAHSPTWSSDGKSVWWLAKQDETYTLVSADTNAKNQRRRGLTTPIPELNLSLIAADIAVLVPKTVSFFETPLFLLNLRTSAFNPFLSGFGLIALADKNPRTQNIAYTTTSRGGALDNIHVLDLKTGKDISWPLKTLAEKCAFSANSKLLFCAVPENPPTGNLPEAWFSGKTSFTDSLYKIDLESTKAEKIFSGEYDITALTLSDDTKKLFFIDKNTGFLYGLSLE